VEQVVVTDKNARVQTYTFDRVFPPAVTQAAVYHELQPLMRCVLDGYSVCVFAYGQTASGKTFTMMGPQGSRITEANKGLHYRALDDLFEQAEARRRPGGAQAEVTLSVQILEVRDFALPLCVSLTVSLTVSPSMSPSPSLPLCLPLCLPHRLSHCVSHCVSLTVSPTV
jgi:hypothetical protein